MIEVVIYVSVGLIFLFVLALFALRTSAEQEHIDRRPERREASDVLASLGLKLPPQKLMERAVSSRDWEFVRENAPPTTRKLFWRERRQIALGLIRQTRHHVKTILNLHKSVALRSASLSLKSEATLTLSYIRFEIYSSMLWVLVFTLGQFTAGRILENVFAGARGLTLDFGRILADLDPEHLEDIRRMLQPRRTLG